MTNEKDALELVFARNAFYKRLHFLALATFMLSLVVISILIGVIIYLKKNPTGPIYFSTDPISRLIKIIPVSQPNMSLDEVTAWTIEAVQASFSFDYINYHGQLQGAEKYFTSYGWSNYMKALVASNNLPALTKRKMIFIGQVVNQPKLITQGLLSGAYAYKFQMPLLWTFWRPPYNAKSKFTNPIQVTVIVQRQEILQSYKGLGIVQLIAVSPKSNQPSELSNAPPG